MSDKKLNSVQTGERKQPPPVIHNNVLVIPQSVTADISPTSSCSSDSSGSSPTTNINWSNVFNNLEEEMSTSNNCSVGLREENRKRNRWCNVLPFDQHRIKLERVRPPDANNYINASLVEVPETGDRFVATQGPLKETAEHFWSMIWEQRVRIIVMLCRTVENDMEKCFQYWPSTGEPKEFPTVRVEVTHEVTMGDFVRRVFKMTDRAEGTGEQREIVQYHFVRWPDFGVPENPKNFLQFVSAVKKEEEEGLKGEAIAVHCSAGIGRSGAFCLIYSCYKLLERRRTRLTLAEIMTILSEMRQYRMGLIQTSQQLRFSYKVILEVAKSFENSKREETNGNGDGLQRRKRTSERLSEDHSDDKSKVARKNSNSHL